MLTFRYLPIKYKQSKATSVFFIIFFAILFFTHIFFVVPHSPDSTYTYVMTAIHCTLWIIVSISFLMSSCRDPGKLLRQQSDPDLNVMNLLKMFHPDDICPRCEVLTTPRSQHCNICDVCVEGWDHHCPWLNNCVGAKTRNTFMLFLLSFTLLLAANIEPPITSIYMNADTPEPKIY